MKKLKMIKFPVISPISGEEYRVKIKKVFGSKQYNCLIYIPYRGLWSWIKKWSFIEWASSWTYTKQKLRCNGLDVPYGINIDDEFDRDFVEFAKWTIVEYEYSQQHLITRENQKLNKQIEIAIKEKEGFENFNKWDGRS